MQTLFFCGKFEMTIFLRILISFEKMTTIKDFNSFYTMFIKLMRINFISFKNEYTVVVQKYRRDLYATDYFET